MEPELKAYLDKLSKQIDDMDVRLRTEFGNRVKTAELRAKQDHDELRCIDGRVLEIESRLMELEFKAAIARAKSWPGSLASS